MEVGWQPRNERAKYGRRERQTVHERDRQTVGMVEQVGPKRWPGTTVIDYRLPRQAIVEGVVRKDKVMEAGGIADEKRRRIDNESHNESK